MAIRIDMLGWHSARDNRGQRCGRTGCTGGLTLSETTNWTAGDLNGYSGSNLTMR